MLAVQAGFSTGPPEHRHVRRVFSRRSFDMRASTAYFAGAGTVIAAIVGGIGGGLLFADIVSPKSPKPELTRLEQRMSAQPIQVKAGSEPAANPAAPPHPRPLPRPLFPHRLRRRPKPKSRRLPRRHLIPRRPGRRPGRNPPFRPPCRRAEAGGGPHNSRQHRISRRIRRHTASTETGRRFARRHRCQGEGRRHQASRDRETT